MHEDPALRIGEVARRSGVASTSIRFYESIGLLREPDREGGQRRYGEDVLGTLSFIGVAQEAGFTLREIGELMSGIEDEAQLAEPIRALSARKLPEVKALIEHAEQMRAWLQTASDCSCSTPDECTLFPAPGELDAGAKVTLDIVHRQGTGCRR